MIALLLNHLWQSSLCVGGAGLIALALHRNGANVRFWLWFAASIKFLVPFAALTALGAYFLTPMLPAVSAPSVTLVKPFAEPFSAPAIVLVTTRLAAEPSVRSALPVRPARSVRPALPARSALPASPPIHLDLGFALLALWATGFLILAIRWIVRWLRVRALLREAVELQVEAPVVVKFSSSRLEPGLVGILHPVILLPQGIEQQLSPVELQAVLAHELCHWRRRDNLLAAIHMLVEALFWFFPLVWWLGARLNAERERACDESVLADGNDPQIYAEGILKVCRAYLQSPLACVAGVSGADLKKRIETIAENRLILQLNAARKFVLSASAAVALALPLALGLMAAPVAQMQAKAAPIPFPIKNVQGSTEQKLPLTPETSTALPTSKAAESPSAGQAPQTNNAETTSADAALPLSAAASRLFPNQVSASDKPAVSNDLPTQPAEPAPHTSLAAAQATAQPEGPRLTCDLTSVANSAELKEIPGSDLVTVPVEINGKPKQFLLDLSTNPTEVSQATVAELGLPQDTRLGSTIISGGNGFSSGNVGAPYLGQLQTPVYDVKGNQSAYAMRTRVRVGAFTIGAATARNMQLMVANDGEIAKTAAYDGLLTNDIFRQYDVEVDFAAKQINYLAPTQCADPDQVVFWSHFQVGVIPMTLQDGKMQVPVTIEGHAIQAVIDTRAARSVMRRDIAELTLGYKADTPGMAPAGNLKDGMGQPVYAHTFSQISFTGGVTAINVPVLIETNGMLRDTDRQFVLGSKAILASARIPDFTIGMDILRHLHLYFASGQGKVYVTAAQ
jgi:beta-lactamase regulating signal transducer with metallopeptidase domain